MRKEKLQVQVVKVLDELVLTAEYVNQKISAIKPTPHYLFLVRLKNSIENASSDLSKESIKRIINFFLKKHQGPTTFFSKRNIGLGRTYAAIQSLLVTIDNPINGSILSPVLTEDMMLMGLKITHYSQFYCVEKRQLEKYKRSKTEAARAIQSQAEDFEPFFER